jgi:hypothetical protein
MEMRQDQVQLDWYASAKGTHPVIGLAWCTELRLPSLWRRAVFLGQQWKINGELQ